jgi:hypothetical protein
MQDGQAVSVGTVYGLIEPHLEGPDVAGLAMSNGQVAAENSKDSRRRQHLGPVCKCMPAAMHALCCSGIQSGMHIYR